MTVRGVRASARIRSPPRCTAAPSDAASRAEFFTLIASHD